VLNDLYEDNPESLINYIRSVREALIYGEKASLPNLPHFNETEMGRKIAIFLKLMPSTTNEGRGIIKN
jgi:hypothetical protein